MKHLIFIVLWTILCLMVAGCGLIEIPDEQIKSISETVGQVTTAIAAPALNTVAPGGVGAGLAGMVGTIATLISIGIMKAIRVKTAIARTNEIKRVVKEG